ncbi:neuronal acetylcholine receptor subunit alpha-9-like [Convolutriloba macropyga]|uniref:neuronal acetylcholine receptor subunit alpha-9-like n=1 Tax=Convolutriloba macropyga TaxID=536237 RepID=UPI003F527188
MKQSACALDVINFPFDTQTCGILIGSWTYNSSYVNMTCDSSVDISSYIRDSVWELKSATCTPYTLEDTSGSDVISGTFSNVLFTLKYKRLPLFYMSNLVLPNAVLLSLGTLTFFIPGKSGEKIRNAYLLFLKP